MSEIKTKKTYMLLQSDLLNIPHGDVELDPLAFQVGVVPRGLQAHNQLHRREILKKFVHVSCNIPGVVFDISQYYLEPEVIVLEPLVKSGEFVVISSFGGSLEFVDTFAKCSGQTSPDIRLFSFPSDDLSDELEVLLRLVDVQDGVLERRAS